MANQNSYSSPTIGEGVNEDHLKQLAPLWEAACKEEDANWSKKHPAPLPGWDGNIWFDRIEDRQRRWRGHYLTWAADGWSRNGLSVAFDHNARIVSLVQLSDESGESPPR